MDYDANKLYFLMMNDKGTEIEGFHLWKNGIQFVLQTDANDRESESAVDSLENIIVFSDENVRDYHKRLTAQPDT